MTSFGRPKARSWCAGSESGRSGGGLRERPVGCGALKFIPGEPADIKRMWVAETDRGLGLGRRILTELEGVAAAHGAEAVRLETNGTLTEAISLYRSAGYVEVPAFNDEPYAHHWFTTQWGPLSQLTGLFQT